MLDSILSRVKFWRRRRCSLREILLRIEHKLTWLDYEQARSAIETLKAIQRSRRSTQEEGALLMRLIERLLEEVAQQRTVVAGIEVLMQDVARRLREGISTGDLTALSALADDIDGNTARLAAAVALVPPEVTPEPEVPSTPTAPEEGPTIIPTGVADVDEGGD